MDPYLILAIALSFLAAVLAFLAWQSAKAAPQRLTLLIEKLLSGQRNESEFLRANLAAMEGRLTAAIQSGTTDALKQAFGQIGAATQSVATTLDSLRRQAAEDAQKTTQTLESRLALIQASVNAKLHEAVEQQMSVSFARVLEQFAQVQQAMGEVQATAAQIGDLKRLFSNVKTRGGWGEAQLGALLEQVLPPGAFERNFAVKEGARERVDFALRMPSREKLYLPVDAKFPTEDYDRLLAAADAADAEAERQARDGLTTRVRLEARKIREKYISPPETVDFAVMYLPSDGLFAEIARTPGLIDDIRAREKIIILGPTLLPAMLQTIHLGHVTLDLEKRAGEIGKLLGATRSEMSKMDDVLIRLAANAQTMASNIEKARTRTRAVARVLKTVEMVEGQTAQTLLGLSDDEEA
ncbi:DNA recombination protein RmuC [Acidocella sp.]|uniref:DNA recombination protein RmuC n=1 Tax=Acidocella sp. TaxID=50710 RepID=UPI0026248F1C|nr:DNA recombination protein RmuC [Acidocella sp.]